MANFFPLVANNSANITNGFLGNRIEELQGGSNLDFTGSGIVNLAANSLLFAGGNNANGYGNTGQVLTSWGNGAVYWANGGGGGTARPIIEWTPPLNANNQSLTAANIAAFPDNTYAAVFVNGVLQPTANYAISGNTLTMNIPLNTSDRVAIGPFGGGGLGGFANLTANTVNAVSNTTASELGFALITTPSPVTSNGVVTLNVPNVAQFRTNANIGNVANLNINANANTFLNGNGAWTVPPVTPAGNTTEIQYNNAGVLAGSPNLTFNGNTVSAVNVFERAVDMGAGNVIDLSSGAYFTKEITGNIVFTVSNTPTSPQVGSFILHLSNCVNAPNSNIQFNFGSNIKWAGGTVPYLDSNNATDVLGFYQMPIGNATGWYGYVLGKDVA